MKNVLIIGGLGFIGSNLANMYAFKPNMHVTILDNLDKQCGGNFFNIQDIKNDIKYVNIDICNKEDLIKELKYADLIINCAAISSHSLSMNDPKSNLKVNVMGVLNILESMKSLNSNAKLIQVGTTTQTGVIKNNYTYAEEDHFESPVDIYSANKLLAEKYTNIYASTYGIDITNIRLPNTYGPRAAIHSPAFTFNNYFIGLALQKKTINVYKPGTQTRNSLYIDDAIEAIFLAGESKTSKNKTYQAVSDEHFSVLEIASKTVSIIGGSVSLSEWPSKSIKDVGDVKFSNKKIKKDLGWSPLINLSEGLKKTNEYYLKYLKEYL
jgi:UDP-glucose 4-epimerase